MKKTLLASAVCFTLVTACGQQEPASSAADTEAAQNKSVDTMQNQNLKSGIDIANIDSTVRPQDDFYRYVNGSWLDKTEIPADKPSYGSFTALRDKSQRDVKAIIEDTAKQKNVEKGSDAQKVGDLYRSYMNIEKLDALGASPLNAEMKAIDALTSLDDVASYFGKTQTNSSDAPFGFWVGQDSKQPTDYILFLTQSGLGLPDREFYLKTEEKSVNIRTAYVAHIARMLELASVEDAQQGAKEIMALETAMANLQWTRTENRDRIKTYNKHEIAKLSELVSDFNWSNYFAAAGVSQAKEIIVRQPSYFSAFASLFKQTPVTTWQKYLKWNFINSKASLLSSDFELANFDFYRKTLNGIPEQEARWKKGVESVNGLLGEVVGKIYVEKHFKPEAKQRMIALVENLRTAYGKAIVDLDWMSEETKKQALEKLAKFIPKIGYPDKWKDYSSLEISADDLFGNFQRAAAFNHQYEVSKLGQPIDRGEWHMNPQTVNAYYNSSMNEIVFPAAILQPPFFNMEADDAVNYGGIGGVIGHEMGHGFDDQGSKSDGDGVLRNWWTEKDLAEFKLRTGKLAAQYSAFEPLPGEHIQGEMTLGENIGDLGGLTIAHRAYMLSLNEQPAAVIDGLKGEERFFMGWAQVWAYKFRDEALSNMLQTDPHSPAPYRGNGTVMNMPEFMQAFDVKPTDGMYRKPEDRVKIW